MSHSTARPIAIIGAGFAGLALARALRDTGWAVAVFEKSRGAGGRAAVKRMGADAPSAIQAEHGCPGFRILTPRLAAIVADWERQGWVCQYRPVIRVEEGVATPAGANVFTSERLLAIPQYVGLPSLNAVAKNWAAGLNIVIQRQVAAVRWQGGEWELEFEDGSLADGFGQLAFAVPAPQLRAILQRSGLNESLHIPGVPMQPQWTVMLATNCPSTVNWDVALPANGPLRMLIAEHSKPGRASKAGCWTIHATLDWTQEHLELTPDEIVLRLGPLIRQQLRLTESQVTQMAAHRWRYGGRSTQLGQYLDGPAHQSPPQLHQIKAGAEDGDSVRGCSQCCLGWCGDWTLGTGIEAAILSGEMLAAQFLNA